jgi:Holliday junction DNA helicase RuvA
MIELIKGKILEKRSKEGGIDNFVTVETGGVGWGISISSYTLKEIGDLNDEVILYTHLVVQDNSLNLFGFSTKEEKATFLKLLSTPKIGAKSALNILSCVPYTKLPELVEKEDVDSLSKVPGIGKKTAAYLLFEWRRKSTFIPSFDKKEKIESPYFEEITSALVSLGCKLKEAKEIATKVLKDTSDKQGKLSLEELIKMSLRYISHEA